jgi:VIT1/CCC1 family predicted Fe2+/Mn2+ transporter
MDTTARSAAPDRRPRGLRVRDVVLGMSDGLTVPFALAAGVSGAVHRSLVVLVAGFAELAAGAISMGLGGYLAAQSDVDVYHRARRQEQREVVEVPEEEREEVRGILRAYGLEGPTLEDAVGALTSNAETWVEFMMREELGLERPEPGEHLRSGTTIGASYLAGGVVPLVPYFLPLPVGHALLLSAALTLLVLFAFGYARGRLLGVAPMRSAAQAALVGGIAAGVAFAIARLIAGMAGPGALG